jgi:hypothetical protein
MALRGLPLKRHQGIAAMARERNFARLGPAIISGGLALVCICILVLLIHDRWSHPHMRPPEVASSTTTGQAARSADAQVLQPDPKLSVEPKPASPGPVQPANPN